MHTGTHTRIGMLVPKLGSIKPTVALSKEAKLRLKWVDYNYSHNNNARLTCHHFGIAHRSFYCYYNRFTVVGLSGLESCS